MNLPSDWRGWQRLTTDTAGRLICCEPLELLLAPGAKTCFESHCSLTVGGVAPMSTGVEDRDRPWAAKVEALAGYGLAAADVACVLAGSRACAETTPSRLFQADRVPRSSRLGR
jgi:hypothetical protein